jgi:hypothetical protein
MQITKRAKIAVGAMALVGATGLAGLAGSAFTGTGVTTTGSAASPQFVGGTVSQSVSGATLSNIAYGFTDTTNTAVNQVTLTFADASADAKIPTIAFTATAAVPFTCSAIESTGHTSTCAPTTGGTSQSGATAIAVTVS